MNRGIIVAHEQGIVTSTSLMVRWPAAAEAADYARAHPQLSVGLHVDLGEWALRQDNWVPVYEVVALQSLAAVTEEVHRQREAFYRLMGRNPTHLDSHQHVHLREPARSVLSALAGALDVPLRHYSSQVQYCGRFYGQDSDGSPVPGVVSVQGLTNILASLPQGQTELACHPGEAEDLQTMYCKERREEIKVLCDPRLPSLLRKLDIQLVSFHGRGCALLEQPSP